jgi:hypothetical protein
VEGRDSHFRGRNLPDEVRKVEKIVADRSHLLGGSRTAATLIGRSIDSSEYVSQYALSHLDKFPPLMSPPFGRNPWRNEPGRQSLFHPPGDTPSRARLPSSAVASTSAYRTKK